MKNVHNSETPRAILSLILLTKDHRTETDGWTGKTWKHVVDADEFCQLRFNNRLPPALAPHVDAMLGTDASGADIARVDGGDFINSNKTFHEYSKFCIYFCQNLN